MTQALRKTVLLIVLALVMLMGLLGWTLRMEAASPAYHTMQSSHAQVAYICPPPPFDCH